MTKRRIEALTSGGDGAGLNAALRGVVRASKPLGWEVVGFIDSLEGLLPPGHCMILDQLPTAGIMCRGGTLIGTTNRGRCISKVGEGKKAQVARNAKRGLTKLKMASRPPSA